jgi:dipeptidyl aminopeptidase/acylaminoacyl peptidase
MRATFFLAAILAAGIAVALAQEQPPATTTPAPQPTPEPVPVSPPAPDATPLLPPTPPTPEPTPPPTPAPIPPPTPSGSSPAPNAAVAPPVAAPPVVVPVPAQSFGRVERGALMFDNIPPPDRALNARLERYLHSRQATFLDWLSDGSMLIATRFADTEQVHRVTTAGGMREQLTFYSDPISWVRAARSGGRVAFLMDKNGDENAQLYVRDDKAEVRQITNGAFIHGSPVWAHDGRRIAFYGNDRDGASYDVYVADVSAGSAPQLVVGGRRDAWYPLDWSADDSKLLVWRYESIEQSSLYLANVATGSLTPVDPADRKQGIRSAKLAPDGNGVYFITDAGGEFSYLAYTNLVSHQTHHVTPELGWNVEDFDVSPDGRYIAYTVNEDGRSRLAVLDMLQKSDLAPVGIPEGRIGNLRFDAGGHRLGMWVESSQSPRDAYVYDLEQFKLERWTHSETGPLNLAHLVTPELVRFPTWDRSGNHQRMLSAYVYRPATATPAPVVVLIHGGPEDQYRPGWDPFAQFLVNELGYAVVAPNVRGSSGYGKSFMALDNGVLREDAVRDIGSLLVWIGLQPAFDRNHVAVMGGSYGGYLALASLIAYGERLSGGIDFEGISNFVTFLHNTSAYRQDLRRSEYGDERNPQMRMFLDRISPLSSANRIRRPLLVAQGSNDPRVPASESEQLVWRVRAAGGEVWYLVANDEGHGFRRKANRDIYLQTAAQFLQRLAH